MDETYAQGTPTATIRVCNDLVRIVREVHIAKESIDEIADAIIEKLNLPSTQPEITRCKECKHHWIYRCMDSMPSEICDLNQTFYDPNIDFCSLAERRTDD